MHEKTIESKGTNPLTPDLMLLGNVCNPDQAGLGLPDRDDYLKDDEGSRALQYAVYTLDGDTHINGRLTLGENTADNGGLRLALMAYLNGPGTSSKDKIDGFSPEQRVFLGWAQVWCETARPEAERLKAQTNPHASNKYRVNGPASNPPEFREAFQCKPSAPMVRLNACRVW